jgi:hypothetical protein
MTMTRRVFVAAICTVAILSDTAFGAGKGVIDTSKSPSVKIRTLDHNAVRWTDGFWADRFDLCRRVIVPNMYQVMMNPQNSANFCNLQIAAGLRQGQFSGNFWSDGDCYKWIEAAAALYDVTHDQQLDRTMDELIAVIAKAQDRDGYISTQMQLTGRKRWEGLQFHELYNMGHLLTAACVHHRATGKDNFLSVARKLGDYLHTVFDPRPKELAHFCFNPSNIMGAAELYRTTGDPKYLKLAKTFVDMRGSQPGGSDQNQAAVPLRKETLAVGHAVTANYLWAGAADVYAETGEKALLDALERIWRDVTQRKMYVTGGVAALHHGESSRGIPKRKPAFDSVHEAFGAPYELPNRTAYNETCANIGNAMWNWRMLGLTGEAKYADLMERVLYNCMLSAVDLEGKCFFYTNPLRRCGPEVPLLSNDSAQRWPDTTPQSPVHCFCCPPSVARTIAEVQGWAYGLSDDAVWVHLYGGNVLDTQLSDGSPLRLVQKTQYPWDGKIAITVEKPPAKEFGLMLRIPGWAERASVWVNGRPSDLDCRPASYVALVRRWSPGDRVEIDLPMKATLLEAHPLVEETRNHAAVVRGPIVYCLESVDLPKDVRLGDVRLPRDAQWKARHDPQLLGGVTLLQTEGCVAPAWEPAAALYRKASLISARRIPLRLIPYYAWCNRGQAEMSVWIPLY